MRRWRDDIAISVARPSASALREQPCPPSATIRARVEAARERQVARLRGHGVACNAQIPPGELRTLADPTSAALDMLGRLHDRQTLSARGQARVLRVARTLADLAGRDRVAPDHVLAAAALRTGFESSAEVAA